MNYLMQRHCGTVILYAKQCCTSMTLHLLCLYLSKCRCIRLTAAILPVECEKDDLSRLAIDLHDRSNLIMDHKVGLFTKIKDSFSGEAFVNWMVKEKESGRWSGYGITEFGKGSSTQPLLHFKAKY